MLFSKEVFPVDDYKLTREEAHFTACRQTGLISLLD